MLRKKCCSCQTFTLAFQLKVKKNTLTTFLLHVNSYDIQVIFSFQLYPLVSLLITPLHQLLSIRIRDCSLCSYSKNCCNDNIRDTSQNALKAKTRSHFASTRIYLTLGSLLGNNLYFRVLFRTKKILRKTVLTQFEWKKKKQNFSNITWKINPYAFNRNQLFLVSISLLNSIKFIVMLCLYRNYVCFACKK